MEIVQTLTLEKDGFEKVPQVILNVQAQTHAPLGRPSILLSLTCKLALGDDLYRVFGVNSKTGSVESVLSETRVTRLLERISNAKVSQAVRAAALRHLQQFDQINASLSSRAGGQMVPVAAPHLTIKVPAAPKPEWAVKTAEGMIESAAKTETSALAKALPVGAKALAAAGAVADAGMRGYQAYEVENESRRGDISDRDRVIAHAKNGAGMAGGWSGAVFLGSQGAAWGSALGPAGTIGGGVAGGVVGYAGGEKLAEKAVDLGSDAVYAGANAVRDGANWAGEQASSVWDSAKSRLGW